VFYNNTPESTITFHTDSDSGNDNGSDGIATTTAAIMSSTNTSNTDPDSVVATNRIGKEYSARACWLEPAWGDTTNGSCVGRKPAIPTTTATHLTCHTDDDDEDKSPMMINPQLHHRPSNNLTIALLYFAKPALLFRQLEEFSKYPTEIQQRLTVWIIDDGSPPGLRVTDYINRSAYNNYESVFRLRVARITTETDWNIGGARNLAFFLIDKEAPAGTTTNVLLLDLDMLVPPETIETVGTWETRNATHKFAHRFNRRKADGSAKTHPAMAVLDSQAYWQSGGCDEDFCGHYGFTDDHFWHRWKLDPKRIRVDHLDVFLVALDLNACNSTYLINQRHYETCKTARGKLQNPSKKLKRNHGLFKDKIKKGCWSNKYLRFRWMIEN
jgi:hypothetical protein